MAKGKKHKAKPVPTGKGSRWPILLFAVLSFIVACLYAVKSPGTYQDDDLDHYYNALRAWDHPELFIDSWGMPLLTLLLAIPAKLFGYLGVEITTALVTASAAAAVGMAARCLKLPHPWLASVLFFFQPLVLELSYSALAEPLGAGLVCFALWAWYAGRPNTALVLAGLLPLARIETAWMPAALLLVSWPRSSWAGRLGAVLPLAAWVAAGMAVHGDLLYVLGGEGSRPLNSLGVLHYTRNLIVICGPVVLLGVVWAVFTKPKARPFPALAVWAAALHLLLLSLLAWEALALGRSIGFLRHALVVFGPLALAGAYGYESLAAGWSQRRTLTALAALAWTALVAWGLSHILDSHSFLRPGRVESRWLATALVAAGGILFLWRKPSPRVQVSALAGTALIAGALTVYETPFKQLDVERQAMLQVVEYIDAYCTHRGIDRRRQVVFTNHPWFAFLTGRDRYDREVTPLLTLENLETAPAGSFVIWENHYGNRLWGNVPVEHLRSNPEYQRALELTADPFVFVLFLKR